MQLRLRILPVVVMKNRITTVTISVLEQRPRCRYRFGGPDMQATLRIILA
jgi:hypothetical protein